MRIDFGTVNWRLMWSLAFLAGIALGAAFVVGLALWTIPDGRFNPEIALTIVLLAGALGLVGVLVGSAAVLDALGLSDRAHAFGLPEGTIRAVIAVSLVLMFGITSVFLYTQLRGGVRQVDRLTQEQVAALPAADIISINESRSQDGLFVVQRRFPKGFWIRTRFLGVER